ncbi:DUF2087 domain-containing protein [Kineothrix sp. MB12-C1]|uniref:DUF2087 domain-containing protein n=1 Tax=Kineothrix sp. MB12-C1 TaxID=3070215 RepID=UPI0027D2FB80|nr:DUF2087 domain-containing protein [Kineothrix sp. MB12-C1]WMC92778.1 DUF2087 domain-containing protein [Kineothrix sp. MB12-C1]
MNEKHNLWDFTVEELVVGYREGKESYLCTVCGEEFKKGLIFQREGVLYDAFGSVTDHHEKEHGITVDYILDMEPSVCGITQIQRQILKLMSEGMNDKEIAQNIGIALSTVRNHRFKLREKEKQAKVFLALMNSLEEKTNRSINQADTGMIEELHAAATMVDDRYNITAEEREKTLKTYMDEAGAIKQFPAKEKKKIILLREITKNFKPEQEYSEIEVNRILERIYEDFPTIRRALIEYGFLDRSLDCSVYRVRI